MTDPIFTERAELDDLLVQAFEMAGPQISVAAVKAEEMLADAVQARHPLADNWMQRFLLDGIAAEMRKVIQRAGVIDADGNLIKIVGGVRRNINGVEQNVQLPLWDMTSDELKRVRGEHRSRGRAARRSIQSIDRLLNLIERVPGAATAKGAARVLGVDVHDVLAGKAAA